MTSAEAPVLSAAVPFGHAPQMWRTFFARDPAAVARDLIGTVLLVDGVGGMIVEAEAYDETDPASHCYGGRRTARNASMFGPAGHAYVYRSYGMHWCLNFVCGAEAVGGGVLIRALEPRFGIEIMRKRRREEALTRLCAGPGRLTQALAITGDLDGKPLDEPPFLLKPRAGHVEVVAGPRIGISRAVDTPWRFGQARSPFLSRPFRARPA